MLRILKLLRLTAAVTMTAAAAVVSQAAEPFDSVFADSTIRIDYVLAGTTRAPSAAVRRTVATDGWAGRRWATPCPAPLSTRC